MLKCRLFYVVHMLSLGLELELIVMAIIPTMDFKKKRNATCRSKSRKVEVAGVEPASKQGTPELSTRLADRFILLLEPGRRQPNPSPSP